MCVHIKVSNFKKLYATCKASFSTHHTQKERHMRFVLNLANRKKSKNENIVRVSYGKEIHTIKNQIKINMLK